MLTIGITGGIGSGKTTVCSIFELLGIPVYYADDASRKLLVTDPAIKEKVVAAFGSGILDEDKQISRKKTAALVFGHAENLAKLNAIMHPAVALDFEKWVKAHATYVYIIKEAAILFESGTYQQMDRIITVTAPEKLRVLRVVKRDHVKEEEVRSRMQAQWSDEEKTKRSTYVVVNDEEHLVIPQVLELHKKILSELS